MLVKPSEMKFVSKSWGWELWITNNKKYCGKKLFVKQGRCCSYHYHVIKDEVLYVDSGKVEFLYEDKGEPVRVLMSAGFAFHVPPSQKHQFHALEDTIIFEFSTQHFDEDSHRTQTELVTPCWTERAVV